MRDWLDRLDRYWRQVGEAVALYYLGAWASMITWGFLGQSRDTQPNWLIFGSGAIMLVGYRLSERVQDWWFERRLELEDEDEG